MSFAEPCRVIGILDDGWSGLSDTARAHLAAADVVIGAARTVQLVRNQLPASTEFRDMDGALTQVPGWIITAREADRRVALLATGDPLYHGIAAWLIDKLGREAVDVLPAPSTVQLAFARLKRPWADAVIASCHSADAGEWFVGATPTHGLYLAMRAIARAPHVAVLTGPANTPARLARALITSGLEEGTRISVVSRLCLPDEAVFADLDLAEAADMSFPEPNVAIVERATTEPQPSFGLDDLEYIQRTPEKGLITKQEARALSLAKLRLAPDAVVWDIGAGSGSVGLEAARLAPLGHVWAIEKNPDDAANARANAARFRVGNYSLFDGKAPEHLADWPDPDAVFIGGSGGELAALIGLILNRLKPGGRLVMNFVTLENLATATAALTEAQAEWDVVQLQASRSQPILDMHRMAAQNPVWIVTAFNPPSPPCQGGVAFGETDTPIHQRSAASQNTLSSPDKGRPGGVNSASQTQQPNQP